ncbi:hypothetical protein GQ55_3G247500 [Panicum hallii var. hallii]|uniref:Uncharacterized protein n=1 Tax=Panicum hallii var. hallii TaxID=1504633 RepID=A0A2T7ED23_9POAL|nr:hypothetical protein GQ55_3G247500 [Panicum hallii var. hallii]
MSRPGNRGREGACPAAAFAVAEEVRALIGERQQGARSCRGGVTCPSPASRCDVPIWLLPGCWGSAGSSKFFFFFDGGRQSM